MISRDLVRPWGTYWYTYIKTFAKDDRRVVRCNLICPREVIIVPSGTYRYGGENVEIVYSAFEFPEDMGRSEFIESLRRSSEGYLEIDFDMNGLGNSKTGWRALDYCYEAYEEAVEAWNSVIYDCLDADQAYEDSIKELLGKWIK